MSDRRKFIATFTGISSSFFLPVTLYGISKKTNDLSDNPAGFKYCLNTSTIRGQRSGLWKDIDIAAQAGYDGVELWLENIMKYLRQGGSKTDLKNRLKDLGLSFENTIAFPKWIVNDPSIRKRALEELKKDLELLSFLGCKRIAAPPAGATQGDILDLNQVAERYKAILKIGENYDILPVLEVWGHSVNLHALSQALYVITECKHQKACVLPDVYHLYRGGSGFSGMKYLTKEAISMFHINDYPAAPNRNELTDADRVYPGDGVAPMKMILNELKRIDPDMVLSLELFNPVYWKKDALHVAKTGLQKMKELSRV